MGFSVYSPDACLGIHVLFLPPQRDVLLFRKGKLRFLYVDVMMTAGEKEAVLYGFG